MSGVDGNWSVVNRVIHYSRLGARLFKVCTRYVRLLRPRDMVESLS